MNMPSPNNNMGSSTYPGVCSPLLEDLIREHGIADWNQETFVWPGATVLLATIIYSGAHSYGRPEVELAGELIGAGGFLLVVVMFASLRERLAKWKNLAAHVAQHHGVDKETDVDMRLSDFGNSRYVIFVLLGLVACAVIMAFAHVIVDHAGAHSLYCKLVLLTSNTLFAFGAMCYYRDQMLRAKAHVIYIERRAAGIPQSQLKQWRFAYRR